jgi:alanyl-tRNA synthetase
MTLFTKSEEISTIAKFLSLGDLPVKGNLGITLIILDYLTLAKYSVKLPSHMKSQEILQKYIDFYKERGHALIPNVSLVPENDPTLLYVNSGMFPLVPYLSGQQHPQGKRLVNVQRCLRFYEDIDNVGTTNRHTIAFHMIGNWSLGDYFKNEQLPWAYEFYVEVMGLDINKMYATVFAGDNDAPKDTQSIELLKEIFAKYGVEAKENERIFALGKESNWWKRGEAVGELGGPDSEIFYYIGKEGNGFGKNPDDYQDEFIEIGNNVFMQYKKTQTGWEELSQKNVDFGGGLERLALAVQQKQDIFETDNFWPIIEKIQELSHKSYDQDTKKAMGVLADHIRASTWLAMDGVIPSNKDQGYMLRRLIRRMVRYGSVQLGIESGKIAQELVPVVAQMFNWIYPQIEQNQVQIIELLQTEEHKFAKVLKSAEKKVVELFEQKNLNEESLAQNGFNLYQSYGYPYEIFLDDVSEKLNNSVDIAKIEDLLKEQIAQHQAKSREGASQKFKGGLASHEEQIVKYHTTTHLLHWALRELFGESVQQKGSNITGERLRFDFSCNTQPSNEEMQKVTELINAKIDTKLPVNMVQLPKDQAEALGALHFFGDKYGEVVNIYYIGENINTAFSKEFCGGPHVKSLEELDHVEIFKWNSIGSGIYRVYVRVQ